MTPETIADIIYGPADTLLENNRAVPESLRPLLQRFAAGRKGLMQHLRDHPNWDALTLMLDTYVELSMLRGGLTTEREQAAFHFIHTGLVARSGMRFQRAKMLELMNTVKKGAP